MGGRGGSVVGLRVQNNNDGTVSVLDRRGRPQGSPIMSPEDAQFGAMQRSVRARRGTSVVRTGNQVEIRRGQRVLARGQLTRSDRVSRHGVRPTSDATPAERRMVTRAREAARRRADTAERAILQRQEAARRATPSPDEAREQRRAESEAVSGGIRRRVPLTRSTATS